MEFSWARVGTWLIAVIVGGAYAVAGTIAHGYLFGVLPIGLVLALVGVAALLAAVRLLTGDRWAALATGAGATIAALVFSGPGPGGSVIVPAGEPASTLGAIWTVALPVLAVVVTLWPNARSSTGGAVADRG